MDFGSLLKTAHDNSASRNGSNYYKTKFDPPKKESKSKTLSSNIQKFLAKKEEEERQKAKEARKKRDELLAMRDTKATNKIKKMLKVIKSANKSVLEEAVNNVNTAVTMQGPDQPDEDDYGYVSQEASAFYSKMMEKYKTIPDEEKFASSKKTVHHDLSSTKDRVRAAIMRQQEEEHLPHKRKRRTHAHSEDASSNSVYEEVNNAPEKKEEKPKPKRPMPPPMDFTQLLKIAEKKQFEPVVIEAKKPVEVVEEPERLMTKKEKRQYEEHKAYKEDRMRREKAKAALSSGKTDSSRTRENLPDASTNPRGPSKPPNPASMRIPKLSDKINNSNGSSQGSPNGSLSKANKPSDKRVITKEETRSRSPQRKDEREYKSDKNRILTSKNTIPKQSPINQNKVPFESEKSRMTNGVNSKSSVSASKRPRDYSQDNSRGESSTKLFKSDKSASISKASSESKLKSALTNSRTDRPHSNSPASHSSSDMRNQRPSQSSQKTSSAPGERSQNPKFGPLPKKPTSDALQRKPLAGDRNFNKADNTSSGQNVKKPPINGNKIAKPAQGADSRGVKQFPPSDVQKARQYPPNEAQKTRQFPPNDVQRSRQFPPSDVLKSRPFPPNDIQRSRQFPPGDPRNSRDLKQRKQKLAKRRIMDDDDSEYDSSLDDFIDDGPQDSEDVSKYIKEIFGYDKRRYRDFDDDDRNMESNYSQVMKEEYISKKIGLMEDLEDMKLEAEEKKRKTQKKKN